ncbi:MAG: serine/threonine-protein kinase, partial [Byssovorax sp.]
MNPEPEQRAPTVTRIGRYALHREIAAGGMATVHIGRLLGQVGFSRIVAIKRLHPQFAKDPEFVAMFVDEARVAARIQHPNVVSTLDVVAEEDELFLVMEYIQGESLSRVARILAARGKRIPLPIVGAVIVGALNGLHAAHEARDERGAPLDVVHRDVSPQNILIGADGIPRVIDFGVAKAAGRLQETRTGQLKGKLAYMAPEQFREGAITRSVDVYAASVVLWEALTGKRLNGSDNQAATIERVLYGAFQPPTGVVPELPAALDAILERGLARAPADRFSSAREMAAVVEKCLGVASMSEVAAWLGAVAGAELAKRAELVASIERAVEAAPVSVASVTPKPAPTLPELPALPAPAADPGPPDVTEKRVDDTVAKTSLTVPARTPETFGDVSSVSATGEAPRLRDRRALVAGGVGIAAILAVAALVMSSSTRSPEVEATTAAGSATAAGAADSSPLQAPQAPSVAAPVVAAAPSASAPAAARTSLRPATRAPTTPLPKATPTGGA